MFHTCTLFQSLPWCFIFHPAIKAPSLLITLINMFLEFAQSPSVDEAKPPDDNEYSVFGPSARAADIQVSMQRVCWDAQWSMQSLTIMQLSRDLYYPWKKQAVTLPLPFLLFFSLSLSPSLPHLPLPCPLSLTLSPSLPLLLSLLSPSPPLPPPTAHHTSISCDNCSNLHTLDAGYQASVPFLEAQVQAA